MPPEMRWDEWGNRDSVNWMSDAYGVSGLKRTLHAIALLDQIMGWALLANAVVDTYRDQDLLTSLHNVCDTWPNGRVLHNAKANTSATRKEGADSIPPDI